MHDPLPQALIEGSWTADSVHIWTEQYNCPNLVTGSLRMVDGKTVDHEVNLV